MVPEKKIEEFVRRMTEAAGSNLESLVLFGSAASGSYHAEYSDLNFLCVLRDTSFASLEALAPLARWWSEQRQPAPLLMRSGELAATTDVFTIELLDMQAHRRVLFGADPLEGLQIPLHYHRVQVEYELREKLLLLRQRALLAQKDSQLWELMTGSVPSFATLFRHALIALRGEAPLERRAAIGELAQVVSFDPSAMLRVLDVRERKASPQAIAARPQFAAYLAAIEEVTAAVDKVLDPAAPAS
jgi:hypothetical protein